MWKGMEPAKLMELTPRQLMSKMNSRQRRALTRGRPDIHNRFLARCKKSLKEWTNEAGTKPKPVYTHLRNMIIVPEMIGNIVGVYSGNHFIAVEIKASMVGTYLGEYSMTYK